MEIVLFIFALIASATAEKPSLGFVIDTTSSMSSDIRQAAAGISHLIENHWAKTRSIFGNFIVSPFNDPTVGPLLNTNNAGDLYAAVANLDVHGGGDCPEKAVSGVIAAVKHAKQKSLLIIFTDGLVKDKERINELEEEVKKKGIVLIVIMTGCCNLNPCPDGDYRQMAKLSHGAFYKVSKEDVHYVMQFLVAAISKDLSKLTNPPKNFNDLLLFISREKKVERREAIESVTHDAHKRCTVRKAEGLPASEAFTIGCNRFKCTESGAKNLEIRCDAGEGKRDCKSLKETWSCVHKGAKRNCICLKDSHGAIIKLL